MFSLNDSLWYWLWSEPTDMRKSFYTLSGLVRTKMGRDPLDGSVYVFINARRDRIKLLHMEPGGLVLYMKVLERGELHVPQRLSGPGTKAIEWRELVVIAAMKASESTYLESLSKEELVVLVSLQHDDLLSKDSKIAELNGEVTRHDGKIAELEAYILKLRFQLNYALTHMPKLVRYVNDGRFRPDNNDIYHNFSVITTCIMNTLFFKCFTI